MFVGLVRSRFGILWVPLDLGFVGLVYIVILGLTVIVCFILLCLLCRVWFVADIAWGCYLGPYFLGDWFVMM